MGVAFLFAYESQSQHVWEGNRLGNVNRSEMEFKKIMFCSVHMVVFAGLKLWNTLYLSPELGQTSNGSANDYESFSKLLAYVTTQAPQRTA